MRRDEITPELLREMLHYDPDNGVLTWKARDRKWFKTERSCKIWNSKHAGQIAFMKNPDPLVRGTAAVLGVTFAVSRVAWAIYYGTWPENQIDHINGFPGDNSIKNLRDVSPTENNRNAARRADNKSGVTGVSWDSKEEKWKVTISVDGRNQYVGDFVSKSKAVEARRAAEKKCGYHSNHGRSPEADSQKS